MTTTAREFVDFWIENSVHPREAAGEGAEQRVSELVHRLVRAAHGQGIAEAAMVEEVGELAAYLEAALTARNRAERDRQK